MISLHTSPHIRWVNLRRSAVVLSLASGQYYGFAGPSRLLWLAFAAGEGADTAANRLANAYHIAASRAAADVQGFIEACVARGLLASASPPPMPAPMPRLARDPLAPSVPVALWTIIQVRWRLRRQGFPRLYDWASRTSREPSRLPAGSRLSRGTASFLKAESLIPDGLAESDCLPRSLALFVFLRRAGFDVTHVIGVSEEPFTAHAWVTGDDRRPLLERDDVTAPFVPLAILDPS